MDWITIKGLLPYDGRYDLDLDGQPLTAREWGWGKRYAGYRPGELDEYTFSDPEMINVMAIVTLRRHGKIQVEDVPGLWERFQDAPFGATVTWEGGGVEDDAGPPPESSDSSSTSNGHDSNATSAPSGQPQNHTGHQPSATTESAPLTWAT